MRNRILISVLAVLLILMAVVLLKDSWSTTGNAFDRLKIEHVEDVDRIGIFSAGDSVEFERKGEEWLMGEEVLDFTKVENLLLAMNRMQLAGMYSGKNLDVKRVSVFIFYSKKKEIKRVEFVTARQGNALRIPGSEEIYDIRVPGFEKLNLQKVFSAIPDFYKQQVLLDLLPSEIKKINVEPISGSAFSVSRDSSALSVVKDGKEVAAGVDYNEKKMEMLFSYFKVIRFEEEMLQDSVSVGLLDAGMLAKVEVETVQGENLKLEIYPVLKDVENEADSYWALLRFNDGGSLLKMNYFYLDLLMRGLEAYQ